MTDSQDILRRVRGLIAAGQHRDQVPGLPGVELEGAGMFSGDRRIYTRGTDEYASAAERGLLDRLLPPPPSADRAAIEEAESLVGAPLPALLKDLYSVANGGFGPGPDEISVTTTTEPRTGSGFTHPFPAHSITLIEVPA
ncbi:SMI1/KNR4 family protein [Actinopolymorpha sp. B9G3]|uniref:SMI1/KNR4 family protein n=1 Tax=Actinopolymorpha sp. B9G3 TaxID=3158970 RepID=UPI0032D95623